MVTSASKMTGQTNSRTTDTRMEITPVAMATKRLPEKNASQSGSWGILELVVAGSTHNSGQNADEGVAGDFWKAM